MAAHHRLDLVVLPLHGALTAADAVRAMDRLEQAGSLEVVDAVVVERQEDGTPCVTARPLLAQSKWELASWAWLMDETLESEPGGGAETRSCPAGSGLSVSFAAELRCVLSRARGWLALIVSHLDADAAVAELRRFPATRLVYGCMPQWMLDSMGTVVAAERPWPET